MEIVRVNCREELNYLYDVSALAFEGIDEDSLTDIMDTVRTELGMSRERVFIIPGGFMNEQYGLTGTNTYKDDLSVVCISIEDLCAVPSGMQKYCMGARWFDDVVDNNASREYHKKKQSRKSEQV